MVTKTEAWEKWNASCLGKDLREGGIIEYLGR